MKNCKKLTAKQYLEQLREIDINIEQNLERLESIQGTMYNIRGVDYSGDKVQNSPSGDTMSRVITRYIELNEQINQEIDLFSDAKDQIIREIRGLHNVYHIQILFKIYVQYKTVKQASEEMGISYSYAIEQHNCALMRFEQQYADLKYYC